MKILKNSFEFKVKCLNCGSILLVADYEVHVATGRTSKYIINKCPCCNKEQVLVEIIKE